MAQAEPKPDPILNAGNGIYPQKGDIVTVHYVGTVLFPDGKKFDSTRDRGKPFQFRLGVKEVIKGWDIGVAKMTFGEKSILICPPQYAYGSQGAGGIIPPNATLHFEIELINDRDQNLLDQNVQGKYKKI